MSKLHIATVWWDLMDDQPEIFVHPNETLLESQVWTEFNAKYGEDFEPYVGEVALAIDHAGGRVQFDHLNISGYGFVKHEDLHSARMSLSDYADEIRADGKYTYDTDEELAQAESRATRIDELAKTLSEAIK